MSATETVPATPATDPKLATGVKPVTPATDPKLATDVKPVTPAQPAPESHSVPGSAPKK